MSRPLLIVNPRSGWARTGRQFPRMLAAIERALGDVEIAHTTRCGHAIDLAYRGALEGHDPVISVGGDGTLNEVVNGLMKARADGGAECAGRGAERAPRLGLIAAGTGGDFRRSLGLQHSLDAYLEALTSGRERTIDVGLARFTGNDGRPATRYFVNVLSAGAGGLVDRYVGQAPAWIGGRAAYYLASLRAIARCVRAPLRCRVTFAGKTSERLISPYLVCVANGAWFGAGMHVAPMARLDDGRLEVVSLGLPSKRYLMRRMPIVYAGAHMDEPGVEHFGCQKIEFEFDHERMSEAQLAAAGRRFLLDVDGDALGGMPLSIEVVPAALVTLAPPASRVGVA